MKKIYKCQLGNIVTVNIVTYEELNKASDIERGKSDIRLDIIFALQWIEKGLGKIRMTPFL